MREALFYDKLEGGRVHCTLCALDCRIRSGGRGACGVRVNHEGTLYTLVDDRVVARHIDPIEKKPLFHFLPDHTSYSIGTVGCNFRCLHCQNFSISQEPRLGARAAKGREPAVVCPSLEDLQAAVPGQWVTPAGLVEDALATGCRSIAYTYNEPTIFYELALDTARLARDAGLANVFVTNGAITAAPLERIAPVLDAANIDLKNFDPAAHQRMTGAALAPVLDSIHRYHRLGIWIEVTTLVVPGYNDAEDQLRALAGFLSDLDPDIPWHVTRFHPTYRLRDRPATPVETLRRAREIGREAGLRFVYTGNVPGEDGENTCCPACGAELIRRFGLGVRWNRLDGGRCPKCRTEIPGVFDR
ncbi:MAG: AmmeMemoRadiSam system radical SAM enzyme [Planctomycetes bacterium]|nr:AmmeMemoRadiSam system radical SAM enzyme [Planctomycetota bacterium]